MYYVNTVLNFLHAHSIVILPVLWATVIVYGLANWLSNPYRKQNKKFTACYKGVIAYPHKAAKYADRLPEEYRRQWRACINSNAKPAVVFEFVPKRKRTRLLWLFVFAAVVSASYVAVFFLTERYFSYLVFQPVFWSAFGLVTIANKAVKHSQQSRARKIYARLITQFNRCVLYKSDVVEETVKQLQQFNRHEVDDGVVGKASALLRNKGLDTNRSVEQQRRLNNALNGLLQAYARNSHVSPKKAPLHT